MSASTLVVLVYQGILNGIIGGAMMLSMPPKGTETKAGNVAYGIGMIVAGLLVILVGWGGAVFWWQEMDEKAHGGMGNY